MLVGKSAHSKQGGLREEARVLWESAVFLHIYLYKTSHYRGFHNCNLTLKKKKLAVKASFFENSMFCWQCF